MCTYACYKQMDCIHGLAFSNPAESICTRRRADCMASLDLCSALNALLMFVNVSLATGVLPLRKRESAGEGACSVRQVSLK